MKKQIVKKASLELFNQHLLPQPATVKGGTDIIIEDVQVGRG